jgi:ATP-dependent exoDNAse (exonuclease V) beta subunit
MEVNNAIIRASAGSGKTYQLVKRYLRLLALGEPPETIAAMTFTRKAAREFFERILQKLAELAHDPSKANGYVDELAVPGAALALLRKVIKAMDRLRLGTIDGFFASVAKCFPFELGLAGEASIMAEDETAQARAEVMNAMLVEITREKDERAFREMLEAWKRATAGKELNRPTEYLEAWFTSLHGLYMECSKPQNWGSREAVWPDQKSPAWKSELDLKQAIEALRDCLDVSFFGDKGEQKWDDFFAESMGRIVGEPINEKSTIKFMLSKDRIKAGSLRLGTAEWMMFSKRKVLDLKSGNALADVLDIIVGRELKCRSERTLGRRDVVSRFDTQYERRVRSRGRLAFADLTWLLAGRIQALRAGDEWQEQWETMRTEWEYRLDSRFRHWLFDEFQDTSRRQWDVVSNLVDEAATDPEGRRSFFAVGDLKQSLYLWRQAEPELFLDVETRYANVRMEHGEPLTTSFRSCSQVLGMVNEVFNKTSHLNQNYPDAMRWWSFAEHKASGEVGSFMGHAALLSAPENEEADAVTCRDELVASLIRNIAPLDRGLSCAILTRSNDEAQRISAVLRLSLKVEVVCESEVSVALDNAVTLVLLSVLQLAVHPADSYAEQHLSMSPLAAWMNENSPSILGAEVRRTVATHGFLTAVREWAERMRLGVGQWDTFSAWRLSQFFDMAAEFDQGSSRDIDTFIEFARGYKVRASEQGRALQVMTIHKAKGLEFDVVIMPHLQSTALDQASNRDSESLLTQRDEHGEIEWLLDKPPSLLCDRDERLSEAVRQDKARLAYQSLCRLYVGMTRAKKALYLVMPAKGNTRSEMDLLKNTLVTEKPEKWTLGEVEADCWHEMGGREWFAPITIKEEPLTHPDNAPSEKLGVMIRKIMQPIQRRTPSGEESHKISGGDLLSPNRESARHFGTLVHELFSCVDWIVDEPSKLWKERSFSEQEGFKAAAELVTRTLASPEILPWFQNPSAHREAWREQSFDIMLDSQWISGVFDRVVLERNKAGDWQNATILDFKTDGVLDEAAMKAKADGYAPQMALYRQAVSRLTGLAPTQVRSGLIFCALGKIAWVG